MASAPLFRQLRLLILLFILLAVAGDAWLTGSRATDWDDALWAVVYPINADGGPVVETYVSGLDGTVFTEAEEFMSRQARRFGVSNSDVISFRLGPQIQSMPPAPPQNRNVAAIMWWSLRLRFWAMRTGIGLDGPPADIRIYVIYHDPQEQPRLAHSLGIKEGLIGVVNAYASPAYTSRNNFVITHELLHTLGATDKYDPRDNQPLYPHGYAEPKRDPLHPQRFAEVMGGRIPISSRRSEIPSSLRKTVIGRTTALEINWPGSF